MKRKDLKVGDRVMVEYICYSLTAPNRFNRDRGTVVDFDDGGKSVVVSMDPDNEGKACERRVTRGQCIPLKKKPRPITGYVTGVSVERPSMRAVVKIQTSESYDAALLLNGKHVKVILDHPEPPQFRKQCSAKDALE